MTTATQAPWQAHIIQQLEQLTADDLTGKTHAVVDQAEGRDATLVAVAASEAEALVIAEDESVKPLAGDQTIVRLDELQGWMAEHPADLLPVAGPGGDVKAKVNGQKKPAAAQQVKGEPIEGTTEGENAGKGKLFDVKVKLDPTKPTVLKLAFSGGLELDLEEPDDIEFYNRLVAGKNAHLEVTAHVAGAKKTHRRDSEGHVDAVVETKSLIIHSIDIS